MKKRVAAKVLKRFDRNPIPKNTMGGHNKKETKRWFKSGLGSALGLKASYTKKGYSGKTLSRAYKVGNRLNLGPHGPPN